MTKSKSKCVCVCVYIYIYIYIYIIIIVSQYSWWHGTTTNRHSCVCVCVCVWEGRVIIFLTAGSGTPPLQRNKTLSSTQSYRSSSETSERSTLPCKWWGAWPAEEDSLLSTSTITAYILLPDYQPFLLYPPLPRGEGRNSAHSSPSCQCVCVCVCVWACKCVTFIPSVTAHVCLLMGFNKVQISVNQWLCTAYASSHEMINRCNTMRTTRGHNIICCN